MSLLLVLTAVTICFTVCETKERVASLVVLPPLVLGYDELYHDSMEAGKSFTPKKKMSTAAPKRREMTAQPDIEETVTATDKEVTTATLLKQESTKSTKIKEPSTPAEKNDSAVSSKTKKPAARQKKNKPDADPKNKKPTTVSKKTKSAADSPAAAPKTKITENKPQRTIIIDTKGRRNFRRNYRSLLKRLKKNKCITCQIIPQDEVH